jgi:hypothetical protein
MPTVISFAVCFELCFLPGDRVDGTHALDAMILFEWMGTQKKWDWHVLTICRGKS